VPRFCDSAKTGPNDVNKTTVKWLPVSHREAYKHHDKVLAAKNVFDFTLSLRCSSKSVKQAHHLISSNVRSGT
jgi:hypothetical protein